MWYYWLLAIVALIVILLYIPMPFDLEYRLDTKEDIKKLKFKIARITIVSDKKSKKKNNKKDVKNEKKDIEQAIPAEPKQKAQKSDATEKKNGFSAFMQTISRVKSIMKELKPDIDRMLNYLKKKINCRLLRIHLEAGFDDAAKTGIAGGAMYGTVYGAAAMVYNTVGVKDMDIQVRPNFTQEGVHLYIRSIFTISLAHIIRVLFMVLKMYRKAKKL